MLEYIVERKRLDDLSSSIIDGRFAEQKHRIRTAPFFRHSILLIEQFGECDACAMWAGRSTACWWILSFKGHDLNTLI